jgi:dihydrolipoamide dehydrogenase
MVPEYQSTKVPKYQSTRVLELSRFLNSGTLELWNSGTKALKNQKHGTNRKVRKIIMSHPTNKTQLIIIGAGPGGYAAAFYGADKGLEVTLIDTSENPGGTCLYRGCIPSKAYLHVCAIINEAKEAEKFGVIFSEPQIDLEKVRAFKDGVVAKLTKGLGQLSKARKITYIQGTGSFVDEKTVKVVKADGLEENITFENAIIATGSRPMIVPPFDQKTPCVIFSCKALALPDVPKKLLVVGAGYIGLELGSVYATLGSEVTVVEMMETAIPGADRDLAMVLQRQLKKKFKNMYFKTKVSQVEESGAGLKVTFVKDDNSEFIEEFDKVFVSVGRRPYTEGLGLDNIGIELDSKGFIKTCDMRRTTCDAIFAIGDITGQPMLAHKASHEARVAVDAILGKEAKFAPKAIPAVMFTDPEVAWCGLTENEAKEKELDFEVAKFPWLASGRALTLGRTEGMTKLIIEKETQKILGVGMIGKHVGDMISEGALAIEMGATAKDLAHVIHPHPTLSETIMEAADVFYGECAHIYKPKRTHHT